MKKNKILLIILGVVIVSLFGISFIKADSGWDTDFDWDSGSSWDWDDDWDSSSSWDWDDDWDSSSSYHSSSNSDDGFGFVVFIIFVIIIIVAISNASKTRKTTMNNIKDKYMNMTYMSEEDIQKIIPNFNKAEFLEEAWNNFVETQNAWMEIDTDKLKELVTNELFNTYNTQLKVLKTKKQKNIMNDFVNNFMDISHVEEVDGHMNIKVTLIASFHDYVVNDKDVVVRGNKNIIVNNIYEITYVAQENKRRKNKNVCPSCGAPLEGKVTNKCPYCNSTIISSNHGWVMSKKEAKDRY